MPHDAGIADAILANLEPWSWDHTLVDSHPLASDPIEAVEQAYFDELAQLVSHRPLNAACPVKFAYTAMHGVGEPFARRIFETFGLPPYASVAVQEQPAADFPTVAFPNPEERGALDLARSVAEEMGAGVVLANDPDADRFTAIERQRDGAWRSFTGNELGTLFAHALFQDLLAKGVPRERIAMTCSAVSSKMLEQMASVEGFHFEERLTGFKWLGNGALQLRAEGYVVPFAYEEAIGYMIGAAVPDKDGISALGYFAQLVARLAADGRTVGDYLDQLYADYGYFLSDNAYVKCYEPATIDRLFERIRHFDRSAATTPPYSYPSAIAGFPVASVRDLTVGYDSTQPDHRPRLPVSPDSQMITLRLENGCTITLRTSGTEPKIKWYIEHHGPDKAQVARELAAIVHDTVETLLEPERNQLVR